MAKRIIIEGVEFTAERVDFYCARADRYGHTYKKGWRLLRDGVVVLSGEPIRAYNFCAEVPSYPTFADIAADVAENGAWILRRSERLLEVRHA